MLVLTRSTARAAASRSRCCCASVALFGQAAVLDRMAHPMHQEHEHTGHEPGTVPFDQEGVDGERCARAISPWIACGAASACHRDERRAAAPETHGADLPAALGSRRRRRTSCCRAGCCFSATACAHSRTACTSRCMRRASQTRRDAGSLGMQAAHILAFDADDAFASRLRLRLRRVCCALCRRRHS